MIIWNDWKANGTIRADLDKEHTKILNSNWIYAYTKPMYGLTAIDEKKQPIHAEARINGTKCSECQTSEFCIPISVEGEAGFYKLLSCSPDPTANSKTTNRNFLNNQKKFF